MFYECLHHIQEKYGFSSVKVRFSQRKFIKTCCKGHHRLANVLKRNYKTHKTVTNFHIYQLPVQPWRAFVKPFLHKQSTLFDSVWQSETVVLQLWEPTVHPQENPTYPGLHTHCPVSWSHEAVVTELHRQSFWQANPYFIEGQPTI
jgi:hypothetical protein